jgi:4-amino-4-deoxy-L-arabinose transferase-like glycosyltransferase
VCLSLGVLLKGPIAPLVCFSTIGALFLWERKFEWARPLLYWVGLSLFCIMTIPWYIAVQIATQGDFLDEAVRVDLGQKLVDAAEGHAGPIGMHTAALPILFWPGTLLLIPGIWLAVTKLMPAQEHRAHRQCQHAQRHGVRMGRTRSQRVALPGLLGRARHGSCSRLAPTKLVHYTLPMYPALALMAGAAADHWFAS